MSLVKAKTKGEELGERIDNLSYKDRRNPFLLNRLKKEAEDSIKVDPINAYSILGAIARFQDKIDDIHKYFKIITTKFPYDFIGYVNYCVSLMNAGYFDEAIKYAHRAYELNPTDPFCIERLIDCYWGAGKYISGMEWVLKAEGMKLEYLSEKIQVFKEINSFLNEKHVSEESFVESVNLAYSLLHKNGIYHSRPNISPSFEILEDEDSKWLNYEIHLDKPVDEVVKLIVELAKVRADVKYIPLKRATHCITISYSSAEED